MLQICPEFYYGFHQLEHSRGEIYGKAAAKSTCKTCRFCSEIRSGQFLPCVELTFGCVHIAVVNYIHLVVCHCVPIQYWNIATFC